MDYTCSNVMSSKMITTTKDTNKILLLSCSFDFDVWVCLQRTVIAEEKD